MAYAPKNMGQDDSKERPDTPPLHGDASATGSMLETMKNNSLSTAGVAYLIGDAAMFAAGISKGASLKDEAFAGGVWALGGLAAARYGNPTVEKELELLGGKLGGYLRNQNIAIPDRPNTQILAQKGGVIAGIERFLYAHPSEMLNAAYAIGATGLIRSGLRENNKVRLASGLLVAAGALTGLLIPEKKPDPEHPPEGMLGKAMAWVQEKPLRLASAFYWANNAFLLKDAHGELKAGNRVSSACKFATAASYIFANSMLAISSKGQDDNKKEGSAAMQQLAECAASVVAAQPSDMQEALVSQISGYLAAQPEAQMKANDIENLLHDKLRQVGRTPLAAPSGDNSWQQKIQASTHLTAPSL